MAVDWMAVAAAMASAAHGVGLGGYRAAKDRAVTSMRAAVLYGRNFISKAELESSSLCLGFQVPVLIPGGSNTGFNLHHPTMDVPSYAYDTQ